MSYLTVNGSELNADVSDHGWQVRVAIDPLALVANREANKIPQIKKILENLHNKYCVQAKLFTFDTLSDLTDGEYDGATSLQGKDRTQRGKEVCIYLPNSPHAIDSKVNYEKMLLELWAEFQKHNIPLVYMDTPDDKKIMADGGIPTPFSITSMTPAGEWRGKHGILYKQFVPYDNQHPLLKIKFSTANLRRYKIKPNITAITQANTVSHLQRRYDAKELIKSDLAKISAMPLFKCDYHFGEESREYFKRLIRDYNAGLETAVNKGQFQIDFNTRMEADEKLQYIMNTYPHRPDSQFSQFDGIARLGKLKNLNLDEIDEIFTALDTGIASDLNPLESVMSGSPGYDAILDDIEADFIKHESADNKNAENILINWNEYIPDYDARKLADLVNRNPRMMQVIYRRAVILEREERAYKALNDNLDLYEKLKLKYGNDKIYAKLMDLKNEIVFMRQKVSPSVSTHISDALQTLSDSLERELLSSYHFDTEVSPYLTVMDHFTIVAKEINYSNKDVTYTDITVSSEALNKKLHLKKPMSPKVQMAILGVVGALVGAAIGFFVGAAITFYSGGVGALPGAILAGVAGMTLAQGLALGCVAGGAGVAVGASISTASFFGSRRAHAQYEAKMLSTDNVKKHSHAAFSRMMGPVIAM